MNKQENAVGISFRHEKKIGSCPLFNLSETSCRDHILIIFVDFTKASRITESFP